MKRLSLLVLLAGCGHEPAGPPLVVVPVPTPPPSATPGVKLPDPDEVWDGETIACAPREVGELDLPAKGAKVRATNALGYRLVMAPAPLPVSTRVRRVGASSKNAALAKAVDDADYDTTACQSLPGEVLDIFVKLTVEDGAVTFARMRGRGSVGPIPKCLSEVACKLSVSVVEHRETVVVPLQVRTMTTDLPEVTAAGAAHAAPGLVDILRDASAACEQGELASSEPRVADFEISTLRGVVVAHPSSARQPKAQVRLIDCVDTRLRQQSSSLPSFPPTRLAVTWRLVAPP